MMEKRIGVLFFLKQPKNQKKDSLRMVYLRITVNGDSKELSTKRQWDPTRWSQKAGRASTNREDARTLNVHLDALATQIHLAETYLLNRSKEITAEALKNHLLGQSEGKKMIMEIFKSHNDQMKTLIGIDYTAGTMQRFQTSFDHTRNFIKSFYCKDDIPLSELNFEFVQEYFYWLKTVRKCNQNTALKYLGNFKKIVIQCLLKGWLQRDPFIGFKQKKKEVHRSPLTLDELNRLTKKNLERKDYLLSEMFSCSPAIQD